MKGSRLLSAIGICIHILWSLSLVHSPQLLSTPQTSLKEPADKIAPTSRNNPANQGHPKSVDPLEQHIEKKAEGQSETMPDALSHEPWKQKRYGLFFNVSIPDFLSLDYLKRNASWFGFRFFYTLPVSMIIDLENPEEQEILKSRLKIATPKVMTEVVAWYKFNFGLDAIFYPFANSFFINTGIGFRNLILETEGSSPLFICLVTPDVSCTKETETFPSRMSLTFKATSETKAVMLRAGIGFKWDFLDDYFVTFQALGIAYPTRISRKTKVKAEVDNKNQIGEAEDLNVEIERWLEKKKSSLETRAIRNTKAFDTHWLPLFGIGIGYQF